MKKYFCWGEDKEDLTEQVNTAVFSPSKTVAITHGSVAKKRPKKWRVCVTCSQGHENVFEGEALSLPKPDVVLKK